MNRIKLLKGKDIWIGLPIRNEPTMTTRVPAWRRASQVRWNQLTKLPIPDDVCFRHDARWNKGKTVLRCVMCGMDCT